MRIIYFDIDTLRPDHLGCYGYHRETSANIDRIASQGVRFDNCYVSDAPCLPSRASMFTGQFGIHSGIVGHGGTAADRRIIGQNRQFRTHNVGGENSRAGLISCMRQQGLHTASFSTFAERHSAWWFYEGWKEMYNCGKSGGESAEEIMPAAIDWISKNAKKDDWLLHVNIWDPHTVYRAPEEFGNPFADEPINPWYSEEIRQKQWDGWGVGGPQEPAGNMGGNDFKSKRQPNQLKSMEDVKTWMDGYDCGIRYADEWFGRMLNALADEGVLDDTVIVITSDHGENQGELGVFGDHQTADNITSRVPMIVRWPGQPGGGRLDSALHYQSDVGATLVELAGGKTPDHWDGQPFADAFSKGTEQGRNYLVVANNAWSCQRAVRWDDYMMIRSYHTGLKNYPSKMLFNVNEDPHETKNLAEESPHITNQAIAMLEEWTTDMMMCSESDIDPMWTVMREGGPYHTMSGNTDAYIKWLKKTGRTDAAQFLEKHPTGIV